MNTKRKHVIGLIMFIVLVFQIIAVNKTAYIYESFKSNNSYEQEIEVNFSEKFIAGTIRWQQRHMLGSLKQSWVKYIDTNNEKTLIKKDEEGLPIYNNGSSSISFDFNIMTKEQMPGSYYYNIISKTTNEILLTEARPQWDAEKVEDILNMLVAPLKAFGNNGGFVVYDSNSGEVFLDTTPINRTNKVNTSSIFDDILLEDNKNKEETETVAKQFFSQKKDSNNTSNIVYMFNEPTKMGDNASDFKEYPLGYYNRQFVEMAILPYETVGFDGQPMQLTILSIVDEKDICGDFSTLNNNMINLKAIEVSLFNEASIILILAVIGTMFIMLMVLYVLKQSNDDNGER